MSFSDRKYFDAEIDGVTLKDFRELDRTKTSLADRLEEVESKFQSIITAFKYGCPPHGGMAPGIDRILMLLLDEPNLREVQAFPTSTSGADYLMGSPSELSKEQLKELGIKIEVKEK